MRLLSRWHLLMHSRRLLFRHRQRVCVTQEAEALLSSPITGPLILVPPEDLKPEVREGGLLCQT